MNTERREQIKDILRKRGEIKLKELEEMFSQCSSMTLRRDLKYLEDNGFIKRTRGGAVAMNRLSIAAENIYAQRVFEHVAQKYAIAKKAFPFIERGRSIYIDAGTTTLKLVDHITNTNATYVTNGITHARMLIHKGMQTYIVGGKIKPLTEAVVGAEAIKSINCFNFTKAFMGANGIDIGSGFTTPDIEEGLIKETAINKSYMAFVLADHSKFRRVYPVTFAPLQKCCIITDKLPTPEFSQATVIKEVKK